MHYLKGGFEPSKITIFDILTNVSIVLLVVIGLFTIFKFIKNKYHMKLVSKFKYFIKKMIILMSSTKVGYFILPALLIQNYFLFDYVRTKAARIPPFIDEYISLASNLGFFNNLDFNAGSFIGGSYSVFLTSGPISAIGGVIGWNLTSKLAIARLSNFYWILFLQFLLSLIITRNYKSEFKFLVFMNSFLLILIPWWQGSLYMIGEFASVIMFVNAIYIFNIHRNLAMLLFSFSIFFGKLLTLLPFLIFFVVTTIFQFKIKNIFRDFLFFSLPFSLWLTLVSLQYENGSTIDYIQDLFSLVLGHQSVGFESTEAISEIAMWNNYDFVRILIVPLLFIYLVINNKKELDAKFGEISLALALSTTGSYLWFWILSPTKWMRYSQHFTIVLVISLIYLISFKIVRSDIDLFLVFLSLGLFIDNSKSLILIFILFSFYLIFLQNRFEKYTTLKVLIVLLIFIDITIPYFKKDTFANLDNIIESCEKEIVSSQCLEDYKNQ
jgi:hypothetical protein